MLNQRPGDGHMAAKSIEAEPKAKLPAVRPNSNNTVHTVHSKASPFFRPYHSNTRLKHQIGGL